MEESSSSEASLLSHLATAPSAWSSFTPILVPLALIAAGSFLEPESQDSWSQFMQFLGHPVVALLVGVSLASLALKAGGRMVRLQSLLESSITKSAVVIMITGAGGAFGAVIKAADIGPVVANVVEQVGFPSLLLPFLLAGALTTSTGSMTVSMVTTSSLMAPLLADFGISPEICLALIGSGSFCVIHANASFFWLMAKLHDVPPQTLYRTYTAQSLCMGICGLVGVLILWGIGIR
jgi:GntP family gluconate:H+ symporter